MGMSMQSVLGRLFRSKPASPPPRPPFRRKRALFEPLESRLLLSADLNPANEALLSNGLQQLKDWSQGLGAVGELAHKLPGVNTDLGTALDLPALLQSKIVSPIQSYLAQGGTQNTDGIVAALSGIIGVEDVTAFTSGDEIRFDLVLDDTKLLSDLPFVVSATSNGIGLTADANGTLDFQIDLDLDFSFGLDLSDGLAPEERFFIEVDDFKIGGSTAGQNLNFGLAVGFLGAQVQNGTFNLNAVIDVDILNPDADAKGHITLSELLGTTIGGLVDPNVTASTIAGNLPVSVQALGGYTAGNAAVAISGNPLATPTVAVTGAGAEDILNFGRVQPEGVLQVLNQVAAWLNGLRSSEAFEGTVPFANTKTFGEVLRYAESMTATLIDQLVDADGIATFATAQTFATRLSQLLGLPENAINASYNASTNQLTFFLRLQSSFAAANDAVKFNLNLAPLTGIGVQATSTLSIDASGSAQFVLGFDLSPYVAILVGDDVLPANGVLSADATLKVSLGQAAYVDVLIARDTTNTTRTNLIADINAAFTAAGLTGITASLDANRLRLTHNGGFTGAFMSVLVPNVATNTAHTELRLKAANSAVDSLTKKAFLRDVRVTGTANATAADIDAAANFGFFGVGIQNGTASANATIDVQFRKGGNNATPMRFSDLFEGLSNIPQWTSISSTGTLNATLPIAVTGNVIALPGAPRVQVSMTNVFQPGTLSVTFPDLQPLLNYQNLDFGDVTTAFGQLVTYLSTIDGFSFLNLDLPLIDKSVSDLVSFVSKFGSAKAALEASGAQTIQALEAQIESAFGISPSALTVIFANQSIEFDLDLATAFADNLALDLDLGTFAGYTSTDGSNLNGVGDLLDVGGSGDFAVTAAANLNLIFGFDLSNIATPRAYIRDDSNIALSARATGSSTSTLPWVPWASSSATGRFRSATADRVPRRSASGSTRSRAIATTPTSGTPARSRRA
jgi:hypothetical protein